VWSHAGVRDTRVLGKEKRLRAKPGAVAGEKKDTLKKGGKLSNIPNMRWSAKRWGYEQKGPVALGHAVGVGLRVLNKNSKGARPGEKGIFQLRPDKGTGGPVGKAPRRKTGTCCKKEHCGYLLSRK